MRKCINILISALQIWTKKLIKSNTPNWDENNPEADGYIKNRTHYKEIETVIDLPETTFEFMDDDGGLYIAIVEKSILEWIPGVEKTIFWDGMQYKCAVSSFDDNSPLYLGNLSLMGPGTNTKEPFFIFSPENNLTIIYTNNTSFSHTISISGENIAIHKIPSEYLPEMSNVGAEGSGKNAEIFNDYDHNEASGDYAHAEGYYATASGEKSHAEGSGTVACGPEGSHAEGCNTIAWGYNSHAEGSGGQSIITVSGNANTLTYSGSFKNSIVKPGWVVSIDGTMANLVAVNDVTDSTITVSSTLSSTAITNVTFDCFPAASGDSSHTEGSLTAAGGYDAHAEGYKTVASGGTSHAEGYYSTASGTYSHAEGQSTKASGSRGSHAEGEGTLASGQSSHAEGIDTKAQGKGSHAEGEYSTASEQYTHAEGYQTTASGPRAHSEGEFTVASGLASHAEGSWTQASSSWSHAQGKYNIAGALAHIVGNGTSKTARSNAHTLDWEGNGWFAGDVYVGSTSGTNRDEGSKKLATEEYVTQTLPRALTNSEIDAICGVS